jgi:AraC-like DNA-binding protein
VHERNDQKSGWTYRLPGRELALWKVSLTGAGHEHIGPGESYPQADHATGHGFTWERGRVLPFLQLIACAHGKAHFESGPSGHINISAGDAILVVPGIRHRYRPDPACGWSVHWIEITGPLIEHLRRDGVIDARTPVYHNVWRSLRSDMVQLIRAVLADEADGAVAALSASALLARVLATRESRKQPSADDFLRGALGRLAEKSGPLQDLRQLAKEAGMSYSSFRRLFAEVVGMPPRRWEILARLGRAREMLVDGATVKQTAKACGFSCPCYFSRRFRSAFGIPPSRCRT